MMMMMYSCVSHYVCKVMKTFAKDTCVGVFFLLLSLFFQRTRSPNMILFCYFGGSVCAFRPKCIYTSAEMEFGLRRITTG